MTRGMMGKKNLIASNHGKVTPLDMISKEAKDAAQKTEIFVQKGDKKNKITTYRCWSCRRILAVMKEPIIEDVPLSAKTRDIHIRCTRRGKNGCGEPNRIQIT